MKDNPTPSGLTLQGGIVNPLSRSTGVKWKHKPVLVCSFQMCVFGVFLTIVLGFLGFPVSCVQQQGGVRLVIADVCEDFVSILMWMPLHLTFTQMELLTILKRS